LLVDIRGDSGNSLLRDESGQVVDGKIFYPERTTLIPEESSPFSFFYNKRNGLPSSYEVKIINYQVEGSTRADPVIQFEESKPAIQIPETINAKVIPEIPADMSQDLFEVEVAEPKPKTNPPANPELDSIIHQFANELGSDLIATVVAGSDGNILASKSKDPGFDSTVTAASISLILQLAARAGDKVGLGQVDNNTTSTDKVYIIARFIGDGSYCWGVIVLKNATLGFIRLMMNEYADKILLKLMHG
jgi:predicted regulator of Ras-like GTPase activity (Roadblock/LC7/MglB family)